MFILEYTTSIKKSIQEGEKQIELLERLNKDCSPQKEYCKMAVKKYHRTCEIIKDLIVSNTSVLGDLTFTGSGINIITRQLGACELSLPKSPKLLGWISPSGCSFRSLKEGNFLSQMQVSIVEELTLTKKEDIKKLEQAVLPPKTLVGVPSNTPMDVCKWTELVKLAEGLIKTTNYMLSSFKGAVEAHIQELKRKVTDGIHYLHISGGTLNQ